MQRTEENIYSLLKNLKILSGTSNTLIVSSGDLGKKMGISQQSASRMILRAVDEGYLRRDLTARRQHLTITEKGMDLLMQEFSELSTMLGGQETTKIVGYVQSGLGEGRYYISRKPYIVQFQEKL
jgi:riboflavin kinase